MQSRTVKELVFATDFATALTDRLIPGFLCELANRSVQMFISL